MSDGSVEIRISGSVDPSLTSSANEAKAAIAGIGDTTAISAKAMAAALAQTGGNLKAITPDMLGLGTAAKGVATAQEGLAAATVAQSAATASSVGVINSSRAAYESLALVHEALSGRFTRMVGTSSILAQALAGQAATTKALSFVTSGTGLAILGTVAAIGLLTAATISEESEEKKLTETALGLGAQSGLTAAQLREIGESASASSQSIRETTKAAEAFAAVGIQDADTVKELSNSVEAYSELIGVKFAEAQKQLAAAMKDPIKGAKDLHEQLGILNGDQLEEVQRLIELGDKNQAVAIITQALSQRIDEARQAGVGLRGEFGSLIDVLSNVYNWIGQVSEGFGQETETILERLIPALHAAGQAHRDAAAAAADQARNEAQLNEISAKGATAYDETPEGRAAKERSQLQGSLSAARDALAVDRALVAQGKEKADVLVRDKQAIEDYTHAVQTYLTPVQKKIEADQLDVKIAQAKHEHNRQLVNDLTQQKALLEESGKIESAADAKALASGAGDVAGAKVFQPKGAKGASIVSEWQEQLHQEEMATQDYFKDQTAQELAFWQGKLALTKAGSKDWLAVQEKIYQASKALAHQTYDEHVADLNAQIEADRDNWAKEKKDWDTKLAYIADHFTKESKEYKNAYREFESAERQHQQQMLQAERDGEQKQIAALKSHLAAEQQIRREDATAVEALIRDKAQGSLTGEIGAATQIAQLHHQLALQEMADAQTAYQAEDALRRQEIASALADYTADSKQYKEAVNSKRIADQQYYDQKRELEAKAFAQQIADIQQLKAAYHSYIDGTVSATISGLGQMAAGQENWKQVVLGVLQSVEQAFEQVITQAIENWIVNLLAGQAQQKATAISQVLSYSGVAGAAGVASFAAAPWPIDLGAPAFGAAMAADAASYASLASLDTGTNYLPQDMVVQAHHGERVIPKADNAKLIQILEASGAGAGAQAAGPWPAVSGGGGDHFHFHGAIIDRSSIERFMRDYRGAVGGAMRHYVRMGGSADPYRPRG